MAEERWRQPEPPAISNCRKDLRATSSCKFGDVCRALWPRKTANELAVCAKISKRWAEYLIAGRYRPDARVMHAVWGEILS
jgi:hypothetical protein